MPKTVRYFELLAHIGVNDDEEPCPIVEEGLTLLVPRLVRGRIEHKPKKFRLKPLKEHRRVLSISDPALADAVMQTGKYREIDPPQSERTRTAQAAAVKRTTRQEA